MTYKAVRMVVFALMDLWYSKPSSILLPREPTEE